MATAETESLMSSFARISSYTTVEPEPGYVFKRHPPKDWPKGMGVKCEDLSYENDSPETLDSTYLDILPSQKIAIVGQKDSGTSSLINALFRLPEPKGRVVIDRFDLSLLSLKHSRRIFGFVPSKPTLFSPELKFNLDPYNKFETETLHEVLELFEIKSTNERRGSYLSNDITEFTNTELRLVALAHAFLEDKKILVIEEEKGDCDWSNRQIQDVIRARFQDHTVITVAHSVDTILNSDRVLVMRKGCITEFERPENLNIECEDELMDIINQAIIA